MAFVDCAGAFANCVGTGPQPIRSAASRLWNAHCRPGALLRDMSEAAAARVPFTVGRVDAAGAFEDDEIARQLSATLPTELAHALNPGMDWYACRGAHFHNDAHFDGVLFGVWCTAGPDRELVFPRVDCRLPASVGSIVIFDPFEPHGVLDPAAAQYRRADYEQSPPNLFLGFEVRLTAAIRQAFGVTGPSSEARWALSSREPVNAETGAVATRR